MQLNKKNSARSLSDAVQSSMKSKDEINNLNIESGINKLKHIKNK